MKKKLTIVGLLGFTFLFGCNADNETVQADLPNGFVRVEKLDGTMSDYSLTVARHIKTGCHYVVSGYGGITQMYNEDGLPYCEGE